MYELIFNGTKKDKKIKNVESIDEAFESIYTIAKNQRFKIYYLRYHEIKDGLRVDYGSHTTFFTIKEIKEDEEV